MSVAAHTTVQEFAPGLMQVLNSPKRSLLPFRVSLENLFCKDSLIVVSRRLFPLLLIFIMHSYVHLH